MKKIAVCGKGGVGKSFSVCAFAKAFSKRGKRVLVIDSDESNQTLYKLFGFNEPPSDFMDFLGGKKKCAANFKKKVSVRRKRAKNECY